MSTNADRFASVRAALGRGHAGAVVPPPQLDEKLIRTVAPHEDLVSLFVARAREMSMDVDMATRAHLQEQLATFLISHSFRRIARCRSPLLEPLELPGESRAWTDMELVDLYDCDCGITDAECAVAETGSIVIRPGPVHGRGISLIPIAHAVVVDSRQIIPDMVDLMDLLSRDPADRVIITGPSKTGDIEMNIVTGVHGPNLVKVFVLTD